MPDFRKLNAIALVMTIVVYATCATIAVAQQKPSASRVQHPAAVVRSNSANLEASGKSQSLKPLESDQVQVRVAQLIELLADPNYYGRQDAAWELEQIGLAAFEQLRQASLSHPNVHVASEAAFLIDRQQVVWWLETDSIEVRQLLKSYNDLSDSDRQTTVQQLAERGSDDALLGLCRIARFERDEQTAKIAALYLMLEVAEQLRKNFEEAGPLASTAEPSANNDEKANLSFRGANPLHVRKLNERLPDAIASTIGESDRPAVRWLRTLVQELKNGTTDLERWRQLIAEEHASSLGNSANWAVLGSRASSNVALRFYRWLGVWISERADRSAAVSMVTPSLELVGDDSMALRDAATWALESDLPELVPALASKYATEFAEQALLAYLLAESQLKLGNTTEAVSIAKRASDAIPKLNDKDSEARGRWTLARSLTLRRQFEWAEVEYRRALEEELSEDVELSIRSELAEFYWHGGKYQSAADTLEPIVGRLLSSDLDLPNAPNSFSRSKSYTLANFYFYSGLAEMEKQNAVAASEFLSKALQTNEAEPNPDIVISMRKIADQEPFKSYFEENFQRMADDFRIRVVTAETELSLATNRFQRANTEPMLAVECNQLAWLLSKCETSPQEAINLSLRSLELEPDQPAYLDTLGRCYFSAGDLHQAVRAQRRAVKLAPYERQMADQLKEFELALAKAEKAESGRDSATPSSTEGTSEKDRR